MNVTILIDLSDRISQVKNPEQPVKDINVVSYVVDSIKKFLAKKGVVNSEDKIKLIFYPTLNYGIYHAIADSLNIDFAKYDFYSRKNLFNQLSAKYDTSLKKLYSITSNAKKYEGSDMFNYIKHRIIDDCVIDDSNYINILVILTDGYIYHKNAMYNINNRYGYLIPECDHVKLLRNNTNWVEPFNQKDYGLIKIDNDLSKLKILVAEINPFNYSPKDFDILKL